MQRKHMLPAVSLVLLSLACIIPFSFGRISSSEIVEVSAMDGWTDTGIAIRPGDLLSIHHIAGEWSPWPGSTYDATGSGGDPNCRCNVMDAVSHAALIGRIGDNQPFLVGEGYRHVVGEAGVLSLGINDVDLDDNSGALEVEVQVIRE